MPLSGGDSTIVVMPNAKTKTARSTERRRRVKAPAAYWAGEWWWDEDYFLTTLHGRVKWETCSYTSKGWLIRLMRLDNTKERAFRRYVHRDTILKRVPK